MTDGAVGFIGVVILFAFAFVWTMVENNYKVRRQRKYEKRLGEYDTWMKSKRSR